MNENQPGPGASPPDPDIVRTLGLDDEGKSPRRWRRWLLATLLVLGAVSVGYALKTGGSSDGPRFRTEAADRGDLTVIVGATGNLEPTNQVDVGSELSGIVETVSVDFNDRVVAGQELARLDTEKLRAQVVQYEASLAAARARVEESDATINEAENDLARLNHLKSLTGGRGVSKNDLDGAEASLARARANRSSAAAAVAQAEAVLEAGRSDLKKAVIRSPIDGVVLSRDVEPGQTVAASLQAPVLFTLAEDLARMELHVAVDEADVGQVAEGQPATFTVDAYPDRRFRAAITQVRYGPKTADGVVTYETVLAVANDDLSLRPGMTATAEIVVASAADVLRAPNAALRFTPAAPKPSAERRGLLSALMPGPPRRRHGGGKRADDESPPPDAADPARKRVWTLAPDGTPRPTFVRTGLSDGTWTEILDGSDGSVGAGTPLVVETLAARSPE